MYRCLTAPARAVAARRAAVNCSPRAHPKSSGGECKLQNGKSRKLVKGYGKIAFRARRAAVNSSPRANPKSSGGGMQIAEWEEQKIGQRLWKDRFSGPAGPHSRCRGRQAPVRCCPRLRSPGGATDRRAAVNSSPRAHGKRDDYALEAWQICEAGKWSANESFRPFCYCHG